MGLHVQSTGRQAVGVWARPQLTLTAALDPPPHQDVSGGAPVEVEGTEGLVYGMEIDLDLVGASRLLNRAA